MRSDGRNLGCSDDVSRIDCLRRNGSAGGVASAGRCLSQSNASVGGDSECSIVGFGAMGISA